MAPVPGGASNPTCSGIGAAPGPLFGPDVGLSAKYCLRARSRYSPSISRTLMPSLASWIFCHSSLVISPVSTTPAATLLDDGSGVANEDAAVCSILRWEGCAVAVWSGKAVHIKCDGTLNPTSGNISNGAAPRPSCFAASAATAKASRNDSCRIYKAFNVARAGAAASETLYKAIKYCLETMRRCYQNAMCRVQDALNLPYTRLHLM